MSVFTEVLTQDILVTSILMGLIAIVGLVGNGLMLRALILYKQLRTDFYTVFGCLSVADSLFLIISVPAHIIDMVVPEEAVTDVWCKGSHYLINACGFIAAYLMVVLAVLRAIVLTNRNNIRQPKACHLLIVCIVISVITLLCSMPIMFVFTGIHGYCELVDPVNQERRHTWLVSLFSSFVPLALVFIIYFMTYMLGKRYFSDSYSPRDKERSWLVTYIIIAFTVCQIPYRVFSVYELDAVSPETADNAQLNKMYTIKNYLMCLVMADKAIRPILYTKLASDLSEAFDEVINCTYCSKHYSMGSRFGRTGAVYTTPASLNTEAACINSSAENNFGNGIDTTASSSSETSATSQTPLVHKDDDADMGIEILQG